MESFPESFRWLLSLAGLLLLAAIYGLHLLEHRHPKWFGRPGDKPGTAKTDTAAEVISVNLQSRLGLLTGADLFRAMQKCGMEYGEMDIFHRLGGDGKPLFSAANMIKPGGFNVDDLVNIRTPGITLFLRLPRVADPLRALDEMWATALTLAGELGADILDENRNPLSAQKQQRMRDEALEYIRRAAMPAKRVPFT